MDKINTLVKWAQKNGAVIPENVRFVQLGDANYGAQCDASSSTIKVPLKILLKLSDAVAGLGPDASQWLAKTSNTNCALKLYLARERSSSSSSFFKPYLTALPTAAEINSPYVWSAEDRASLQGTNLGSSLKENTQHLVEEWWSVVSQLPESMAKPDAHFVNMKFYYEFKFYSDEQLHEYLSTDDADNWTSFPAYLWASMILKSRSFPSVILKNSSPHVKDIDVAKADAAMLIPIVDLLNHNPRADVTWSVKDDFFEFQSQNSAGSELFNNYGRKGNEELLLAYGFCLPDNSADTVALKIKVSREVLPQLEASGVVLPKISDYTTSVVSTEAQADDPYNQHKDGLLFFIAKDHIPEDLVKVFQWLVKNAWENGDSVTVRMQLSGLNHLRQALESKASLLDPTKVGNTKNEATIKTYVTSQKAILQASVTSIKHREKALLAEYRARILTLKSVYKKDAKFARSLLVTMGVTCYEDILQQELSDQIWLLYLIRCYNKNMYGTESPDEQFLPDWLHDSFSRMDSETEITAAEVVQFQPLYENLILPMNKAVPEIYDKGKWTVRELIVSTRLLDTIGFVRGKNQECLLVDDS